jgi:hypothetical protein
MPIIDSVAGTCFNKTTISTSFSFLPDIRWLAV